jgi:TDG/mug DNA glycosylase family protein
MDRLPDQLQPDLRLVFVGTAASTRSADLGHYYAHPDICKSGAGMDHQIKVRPEDLAVFRAKMLRYRPGTIAFTSKKAASPFYGRPTTALALGRQPPLDDFPDIFVLPSPSGAASGHWSLRPWQELAEVVIAPA